MAKIIRIPRTREAHAFNAPVSAFIGGEGRNRSPQASFLPQKCLILRLSQALHHHYPIQHFLNTFADVFADSLWVCLTEL